MEQFLVLPFLWDPPQIMHAHTYIYVYISIVICCVGVYLERVNPGTLNDFFMDKKKAFYKQKKR